MAKILSLNTWERVEYRRGQGEDEIVLAYKVKRLRFDQAGEFVIASAEAFGALARVGIKLGEDGKPLAPSVEEMKVQTDALRDFYAAVPPELLKKAFEDWAKDVEGLVVDGAPATSGASLYEVADQSLVLFHLTKLREHARLAVEEGKASGSPSTSSVAPETAGGASDATPTAPEGGRTH
jgi:hypothetical protein